MRTAPRSAVSGIGFPALPPPAGANVLAVQAQLAASARWSAAQRQATQHAQLARLVAHAAETVPLQAERLRAAGWTGDAAALPQAWDRLVPMPRNALQAAGAAAFATRLPQGHGRIGEGATSGSLGMPLRYRRSDAAQFLLEAQALRQLLWHDIDLAGTQAIIRRDPSGAADAPEGRRLADWGGQAAMAFATGPSHRLDVLAPVETQLAWLEARQPAMLVGVPSTLAALARRCLAEARRWPWLHSVHSFGEVMDAAKRQACQAAWGRDPIDIYSAEEIGPIALQCPEGRYHHCAETVLVEVLDEAGRPCGPGATGQVVVTSLHNFAMPLLRYAIGDMAEVGPACPCGRTLPVMTRILGRERHRFVLPSGERRFAFGPPALAAHPAIRQYQVAQLAPDLVEVRIVAAAPLRPEEEAAVAAVLADGLGHAFPLRFAYVDAIQRSPGGKFLEMVCEIPGLAEA